MDKLKPILNQHYWIVFVAALGVSIAGWWMASSEISAATEKAEKAADAAFQGVPDGNSPNDKFPKAVQGVNQTLAAQNKQHNAYLWEAQVGSHQWPNSIKRDMQGVPYRGEIPKPVRNLYRKSYFPQLNDTPQIVDAFPSNPLGTVMFELDRFSPQVGPTDWQRDPPDSETMWNVQEDLWLLRALLTAVAETNRGYDSILQSPIKEIEEIVLRGGNPDAASAGGGAGAGAGAGDAAAGPEAAGPGALAGGNGLGIPGLGGKAGGRNGNDGVELNLDEIFGPDALNNGAGAGPGAGPDAAGPAELPSALGPGAFGPGGGGRNQKNVRRYVDDVEGAPFKTRGFYLQVVMEHTKLSELMVHLANLDWPVEILRVQIEMANPDQFTMVGGGNLPGEGRGARAGLPGRGRAGRRNNRRRPGLGRLPEFAGDMGPGGIGADGRDRDAEENAKKLAEGQRRYQAGMQKSTLAVVAIAGKFTIFQPPPKDDAATVAGGTPPVTPDAGIPGATTDTAGAAAPDDTGTPAAAEGTTPETATPPATTPAAGETPEAGQTPADAPAKPAEPAPQDTTEKPATGTTPAEPAEPSATPDSAAAKQP